jgi:hypothetical protein
MIAHKYVHTLISMKTRTHTLSVLQSWIYMSVPPLTRPLPLSLLGFSQGHRII